MDGARLALADSVINAAIAEESIPGAVLAVVRDDELVYLKAYGNKQVVPDTVAMTAETVFDLASVSKCVGTTMAVMQLVEQGQVRGGVGKPSSRRRSRSSDWERGARSQPSKRPMP